MISRDKIMDYIGELKEVLYSIYLFEAISLVKTKKNWGVVYLPPEKTKTETNFICVIWTS